MSGIQSSKHIISKLTLLIAPAGRGKTHYCVTRFKEDISSAPDLTELRSFYIVPTKEHAERITDLILRDKDIKAIGRSYITTYDEFVRFLIGNWDLVFVTDVLKRVFVREILTALQLDYFQAAKGWPGFLEILVDFISEVKESGCEINKFCRSLREVAGRQEGKNGAARKYLELEQILLAYERRLRSENLRDISDLPHLLSGFVGSLKLEKSNLLVENLYIDGFFELTAGQLSILETLKHLARSITITLTGDRLAEENRFSVVDRFRNDLRRIGFVEKFDFLTENLRTSQEDLKALEANIFKSAGVGENRVVENIEVIEGRDDKGEIEAVAREIRKLYASGKYHFSDFCVILRRIGGYRAVLETVFEEFELPVHIHERKMLRLDPLASSVINLLEMFASGWKRESVERFLHSALASDASSLCFLIERHLYNQVVGEGREGWLTQWRGFPEEREQERLDWLNRWAILEDRIRSCPTVKCHIGILKELLTELVFRSERLAELVNAYPAQAYALRRFFDVLDELVISFKKRGDQEVSFEEFYRLLRNTVEVTLYSEKTFRKNSAQVYDISIARQKEYKVVFMCGLVEKIFPERIGEDPILKDSDRRLLNSLGSGILLERLPRQALERYLFYLGITRASDRLYLTYPRFALDGSENVPSYYFEDVRQALAGRVSVQRQSASRVLPDIGDARTLQELECAAVLELFERKRNGHPENEKDAALVLSLANYFCDNESFSLAIEDIYRNQTRFGWADRHNQRFEDDKALKLLSYRDKPLGATRLETYGACPFRYFLAHEVCLSEPDEELSKRTVGTILHMTLEEFFKKGGHKEKPDLAKEIMYSAFAAALKEKPLLSSRSFRLEVKEMELRGVLDEFLERLPDELKFFNLSPYFFEHRFGHEDPALELVHSSTAENSVMIWGAIDRIDCDEERRYAVIIDYKLAKGLQIKEIGEGLLLQLPLYILAAEQNLKVRVIGAYLFRLSKLKSGKSFKQGVFSQDGLKEIGSEETTKQELRSLGISSKNVFSENEFRALIGKSVEWAREYSTKIRSGRFPVYPKDCLMYCKFKPVCRIEKWMISRIQFELSERETVREKAGSQE